MLFFLLSHGTAQKHILQQEGNWAIGVFLIIIERAFYGIGEQTTTTFGTHIGLCGHGATMEGRRKLQM
jgi:hypothetical protein